MKKSKPGIAGIHEPDHLFRGTALKHHCRLVLPRFLEEEAARPINRGAEMDAAHASFVRWANLETDNLTISGGRRTVHRQSMSH